ncbi:MAG: hypothetical protein KGL39_16450 [Patescibacteria group bacterium]|nr:hypothetical protein [Patescibacteria group bacterium]
MAIAREGMNGWYETGPWYVPITTTTYRHSKPSSRKTGTRSFNSWYEAFDFYIDTLEKAKLQPDVDITVGLPFRR